MKLRASLAAAALALVTLAGATSDSKADVRYIVDATFDDGSMLTGDFTVNVYGFLKLANLDLTTVNGSISGYNRTAASTLPEGCGTNCVGLGRVFPLPYLGELQLTFQNPLGSFGPDPIIGVLGGPSFENESFAIGGPPVRYVINGVATGVPEPTTWALMLVGFVGLCVAGYRLKRTWPPDGRPFVCKERPLATFRHTKEALSNRLVLMPEALGEHAHNLEREIGCVPDQKKILLLGDWRDDNVCLRHTVALRGESSISAISPKISFSPSVSSNLFPDRARTIPFLMTKNSFAESPSRKIVSPALKSRVGTWEPTRILKSSGSLVMAFLMRSSPQAVRASRLSGFFALRRRRRRTISSASYP
jgi:hypothetical protein